MFSPNFARGPWPESTKSRFSKFDETSSNAVNSLLQPLCKALETSFQTTRIRVSWKPKRPEALTQTLTAGNLTEICNLQTISFRQILGILRGKTKETEITLNGDYGTKSTHN